MEQICEYFNGIKETVENVFLRFPELRSPHKGRDVLIEVQKIFPRVNPDTVLRAYRKLRQSSEKDFNKEKEWSKYFGLY